MNKRLVIFVLIIILSFFSMFVFINLSSEYYDQLGGEAFSGQIMNDSYYVGNSSGEEFLVTEEEYFHSRFLGLGTIISGIIFVLAFVLNLFLNVILPKIKDFFSL